jgi:ubiquinone/menaquinone biosynthesis C-methylase UbiE
MLTLFISLSGKRVAEFSFVFCAAVLISVASSSTSFAQDKDASNKEGKDQSTEKAPPGRDVYLGRRVAQTMHYLGAPWLTRESRDREEDSKTLFKELRIKPGMVVCDMGCGNGFYTLPMSKAVGKKGKVYAVDVQVQMLHYLKKRAGKVGADNIEYVLGAYHDPKLPANSQDMIVLVDVYHEFSHPVLMLKAMRKALKPEGVLVLLEFRMEDPKVPIKLLHKMSKKQVEKELTANGFKLARSFDKLPWQHMLFYKRDDAPSLQKKEKKD